MQEDNYDEAIDKLYGLTVMLYGGYYEPKSDRDKELADDLHKIWMKHCVDKNNKHAGIFDPKSAHPFTVEAGLKAFAYAKIKEN